MLAGVEAVLPPAPCANSCATDPVGRRIPRPLRIQGGIDSRGYDWIGWSREKVSAYATLALRRQLERDGLDDLIGELIEVKGPLDEDAVDRYVDEWR
jgi:hypothetical protein